MGKPYLHGLKPSSIAYPYGSTEEAAEKVGLRGKPSLSGWSRSCF